MFLPVISTADVKKFLCLQCGARFEEELYNEAMQEFFCIHCGSVDIMPFRESAMGQVGCSAKGCGRRVENDGQEVTGGCGGCSGGCGCG